MTILTVRHASLPRRAAPSNIIRVIFAPRAKNSDRKLGRKLDLNSVTAGALVRLVQSVFIPACVSERPISLGEPDGVYAPIKSVRVTCAVKQHVVRLFPSRADPPTDRSQRSVWYDQGEDQGFREKRMTLNTQIRLLSCPSK